MARTSLLLLLVFVFYCVEMGTFLLLWPWSGMWDQFWMQLPWSDSRMAMLTPVARSLVSGFGGLHLVWGAHDLDLFFATRRARRETA